MTDLLFGLVASHGVPIVLVVTYLSCLAVPVPSSLVMLAAGAFVASGDLGGWQVVAAALGGAVLGDQTGYELGRRGGAPLLARMAIASGRAQGRAQGRARVLGRARAMIDRWGGGAVFLTRWAMSPLGPYVNPLAGALGMSRLRFAAHGIAGEAVWVTIYVGLGYLFGASLPQIADLMGSTVGLVTAGGIAAVLGAVLWGRMRHARPRRA